MSSEYNRENVKAEIQKRVMLAIRREFDEAAKYAKQENDKYIVDPRGQNSEKGISELTAAALNYGRIKYYLQKKKKKKPKLLKCIGERFTLEAKQHILLNKRNFYFRL